MPFGTDHEARGSYGEWVSLDGSSRINRETFPAQFAPVMTDALRGLDLRGRSLVENPFVEEMVRYIFDPQTGKILFKHGAAFLLLLELFQRSIVDCKTEFTPDWRKNALIHLMYAMYLHRGGQSPYDFGSGGVTWQANQSSVGSYSPRGGASAGQVGTSPGEWPWIKVLRFMSREERDQWFLTPLLEWPESIMHDPPSAERQKIHGTYLVDGIQVKDPSGCMYVDPYKPNSIQPDVRGLCLDHWVRHEEILYSQEDLDKHAQEFVERQMRDMKWAKNHGELHNRPACIHFLGPDIVNKYWPERKKGGWFGF